MKNHSEISPFIDKNLRYNDFKWTQPMIYPQKGPYKPQFGVKISRDTWCYTYAGVSARKKKEYIHIYLYIPDYVYMFVNLGNLCEI